MIRITSKMLKIVGLLTCIVMFISLQACVFGSKETPVYSVSYAGINSVEDYDLYASEVRKDGNNNDDPVDNGIVNCSYFELEINGESFPVYTTRAALGLHNFAYVFADEVNGEILLNIKVTTKKSYESVIVLPESKKVSATKKNNLVTATVTEFGDYTFVFDNKPDDPLTVFVAPNQQLEVPSGWSIKEFTPSTYTSKQTDLKDEQTVYLFKAGRYKISSISGFKNAHLYFEPGCYLEGYSENSEDSKALFQSGGKDIKIYGHAIVDCSAIQGGDEKKKGVYNFSGVSNVKVSGMVTINSNNWTMCFTNSNNIQVSYCMFFGYRTYSDGIMLSDCQNSGADHCFVRTGDDAIETKSTGRMYTDGVLYEYNTVWTDKGNAYGAIYEANNSMKNVVFRNCSVGFAQPTWAERLGVLVVQMGDNVNAVWEDIHFENIEVYRNDCALINITLRDEANNGVHGGTLKSVYFKNINAKRCYGLPFRLYVISGGRIGKVYLNDVYYNGNKILSKDIFKQDVLNITNSNFGWDKEDNIIINSLDI